MGDDCSLNLGNNYYSALYLEVYLLETYFDRLQVQFYGQARNM